MIEIGTSWTFCARRWAVTMMSCNPPSGVVSGGVLGAGLGKRLAEVHWGVMGRIVLAWIVTLPAAAAVAAGAFKLSDVFGSPAVGATVVGCLGAAGAAYIAVLAHRNRVTAADV